MMAGEISFAIEYEDNKNIYCWPSPQGKYIKIAGLKCNLIRKASAANYYVTFFIKLVSNLVILNQHIHHIIYMLMATLA